MNETLKDLRVAIDMLKVQLKLTSNDEPKVAVKQQLNALNTHYMLND